MNVDLFDSPGQPSQREPAPASRSRSVAPPKWFNSPVRRYKGNIAGARDRLPVFERRAFGLTQAGGARTRVNASLETIARCPINEDQEFVPVGVVSPDYVLVQHRDVFDVAVRALSGTGIATGEVEAELRMTEYGERMALSLFLPERYAFDPGDGHPMALRLEIVNSVERSTRFRALLGWFRFICSNGLTIGVTRVNMRQRHVGIMRVADIGDVLATGLRHAETDKRVMSRWCRTPVRMPQVASWANGALRRQWGLKAATRAFHIARTGYDAEAVGQGRGRTPSTAVVRQGRRIPGSPEHAENLFDISQALAWLAQDRRDLQEQMQWREEIPELLGALVV